jgi:two-component system sensor histidine kinase MtrB
VSSDQRSVHRGPLRRARHAWRASIQFRVVVVTVVLSVVVVVVLGLTLLRLISSGLVSSAVDAGVDLAAGGAAQAEAAVAVADEIDPGLVGELLTTVVDDLARSGGSSGRYDVLLLNSDPGSAPSAAARATRSSGGVRPQSVPTALVDQVGASPSVYWSYSDISYRDGTTANGFVVGQQINVPSTGLFELYYVFPLTDQEETFRLVSQAVGTAGVLLVLMLAGVGWLVIRQVVTPVQQAALTAERLSAGDLSQRLDVEGEESDPHDELERLALSFNHMAESLQAQILRLEDLSRMQQRFVSDVSHELRTPLTTVRMAADLLHDNTEELPARLVRALELMRDELDRFEALLADLLEISRIDAGAAALELEEADLGDVVHAAVAGLRGLQEASGSEVLLDLPAGEMTVTIDPRRVSRILRNLVANALQHGEGRPVRVSAAVDATTAAVAVRDYGAGLTQEEQASVFDRFWRADLSRNRAGGGTGLGLAIATEDARLHSGWLSVWGAPGHGSQFVLTLPRHPGLSPTLLLPVLPADAAEPVAREGGSVTQLEGGEGSRDKD